MTVDNMYSISVTSKFDIFYEDVEEGEDPNDMIIRLEAERAKLKTKAKSDKGEKKKISKDAPKKLESKENLSTRTEKPADKKGKRPEKKDGEKPPRFANRQNRDGEGGQQREDREVESRENSGPPRGRGGYRGDRGGNRGGYRGRGAGFRGGRDGPSQRPSEHGTSDEWNVQGSENQSGDGWGTPANENDSERRSEDRGYRGGSRGGQGGFGRGGGFGGRGSGFRGGRGGPRGGFRNAGREYERHSGSYKTGVKPIDKRDGAGAHNWGTMKDELDVSGNEGTDGQSMEWTNKEAAAPVGSQPEATDDIAATAPTTEEGADEETAAAPAENAPVTMTLDEYRAQQAKKKAELRESLKTTKIDDATRKINDGQDAFKNMVRYQKEKIIDDEDEEDEEEDDEEEDEDHQRSKQIVIDVRFSDAPRRGGGRFAGERGGRGGRGGGDRGRGGGFRGGRGSGNFRGGYDRAETRQFSSERPRSQQAQIRLNDENDFPSLK